MQLSRKCLEVSTAKRSLMDRGSIKELSRGQKVTRSIDLAIERFRGAIEIA